MSLVFTLMAIAAIAFIVLIVAFPVTQSPWWDQFFVYTLYVLGGSIVVLGVVGTIGSISGLL